MIASNTNLVDDVLTLSENADTTLSFTITTNPMTTPTLTRDGSMVNTERVRWMDNNLVISDVQRSDAGVYVVTVSSQGASPEVSVTVSTRITLVVECKEQSCML